LTDRTGSGAVRIALGLLLLIAAFLNAFELAPQPVFASGLLDNRRLLPGVVDFPCIRPRVLESYVNSGSSRFFASPFNDRKIP